MNNAIGKPQVLREVNLSLIQKLIFDNGPISKPELSRISGLSLPTVNKLVEELTKANYITEAGLLGNGAGRKAMLFQANQHAGCFIALYYTWGKYQSCVADITGKMLFERNYKLDNSSMQSALESTLFAIDSLRKEAPSEIKAIGIGVPGAVLPCGHLLGIPKIDVWEGFNLEQALRAHYKEPIYIENDVKLSAVGFYHTHVSSKLDNIVYIYAGNGMGSGIILNSRLYRGSSHFSGELGFMAPLSMTLTNDDYTSKGGYLEGLLREFVLDEPRDPAHKPDPLRSEQLSSILCGAIANYIAVLNPDAIILGGELFDDKLIELIVNKVSSYAPKSSMPEILYDQNPKTGITGLVLFCLSEATTRTQLIQDLGV